MRYRLPTLEWLSPEGAVSEIVTHTGCNPTEASKTLVSLDLDGLLDRRALILGGTRMTFISRRSVIAGLRPVKTDVGPLRPTNAPPPVSGIRSRMIGLRPFKGKTPGRNQRGRPPKDIWFDVGCEAQRIFEDQGLPEKQATLTTKLLEYCSETYDEEPAYSTMKERTAAFYKKRKPAIK